MPGNVKAKLYAEELLTAHPELLCKIPTVDGRLQDLLPSENREAKTVEHLVAAKLVFVLCGLTAEGLNQCSTTIEERFKLL
uniref:GLOBIN domain-containing protein n=1 Tax=Steinernema glaseri TaxID=37863 RepID=A0A1I7YIK3_9BILA